MCFKLKQYVLVFIGVIFTQIIFAGTKIPTSWLDARETEMIPLKGVRIVVRLYDPEKKQFQRVRSVPAYTYPRTNLEALKKIYFFFNLTDELIEDLKKIIDASIINFSFREGLDPFNYQIIFQGVNIYDTKDPSVARRVSKKNFYIPVSLISVTLFDNLYYFGEAILEVHFYPSVVQFHEE